MMNRICWSKSSENDAHSRESRAKFRMNSDTSRVKTLSLMSNLCTIKSWSFAYTLNNSATASVKKEINAVIVHFFYWSYNMRFWALLLIYRMIYDSSSVSASLNFQVSISSMMSAWLIIWWRWKMSYIRSLNFFLLIATQNESLSSYFDQW